MKKLLACVPLFVLVFVAGRLSRDTVAEAAGGGGAAVVANGDVNGDGGIDVTGGAYGRVISLDSQTHA